MDARDDLPRRSRAVALMRQALALLDEERDGYILMRLQHAVDEAEGSEAGQASNDTSEDHKTPKE